jgi:hypothetical protein
MGLKSDMDLSSIPDFDHLILKIGQSANPGFVETRDFADKQINELSKATKRP